ncbi:adenosylmethionine--8-amino-7-oxononanoate transaminase [Chitinivibrio alkaliphilus ACht1]|uniref:Adenosylmethionine-8-amino-7-oxononanoate aminotransferase n=2 Tax=Chitinivibrio TaxID=1505231 RepID=U7DBI4_9BACT|nr:adenosylmethionine--8-amino-7-oxononanoate transaminase [Chitinivibrio alkaliphilus]ERP39382.1 adenosylmethionine--8-amino-7-oxononanoate transaminase [Chitinivibrio alkaliphilus ACht1]
MMTDRELLAYDRTHLWHPYTSTTAPQPVLPVAGAEGSTLILRDGTRLIDGMSSWWAAIHGYGHPVLDKALHEQADAMSHVMFGGLTHEPAVELAKELVEITPQGLEWVFLADSGSVSMEVAMKMAVQYWYGTGRPEKHRFISLRKGYHGDTTGAMSLCDPETGMHSLFMGILPKQISIPAPVTPFSEETLYQNDVDALKKAFETYHGECAAFVLEPIIQGAGGMNIYSPAYLREVRRLCSEYDVLLIADEIATGFGRTGELFACNHGGISPDICCVGKALTGGYLTLAATLATEEVAHGACHQGQPLMHGPTFMANPLACAVARASLNLLRTEPWKERVIRIEQQMHTQLSKLALLPSVADVRCLGAIAVIEMTAPVDPVTIQERFVAEGVWVRPFGTLVYLMPPFIITPEELTSLCSAVVRVLSE